VRSVDPFIPDCGNRSISRNSRYQYLWAIKLLDKCAWCWVQTYQKEGGWNSSRSFIFSEAFDIPLDANLKGHWTIDTIIVSSLEPFSISQVHILPVVAYIGSPCSHESRFLVSSRPQPACELYQGRLNHPPLVEEEHSLERHLRRWYILFVIKVIDPYSFKCYHWWPGL